VAGEAPEALILAEGLYATTDAKTAHGLVRKSLKYRVVGVIDSKLAGRDAGEVLDGVRRGIRIYASLEEALREHPGVKYLIVGVATTGGRLPPGYREVVKEALRRGISVVSGLHEFLSDDPELAAIARGAGAEIVDVRKIYYGMRVHYTGKMREVKALKVVVVGTDSAVGKRTTALMLADELNARGVKTVFVGTGQTAWMQGAKYVFVLDSVVNDFVPGVLEDTVWRAYVEEKPKFPEFPMPPLEKFIKLIELLTDKPPFAITLNTEGLGEVERVREAIEREYGIPTVVPLKEGLGRVVDLMLRSFPQLLESG
jgi:uncharacterized NAD-dependent epimerase/dehydratase family protein